MRVLFSALSIASTGGVEMYLLDLSRELLRRGWQPCVYAPTIGPMAQRFRQAAIPVCDDLRHLHVTPDIIHGNFGLSTFAAACRFPQVPVVSMCHAWRWRFDLPPLLPNVHWYLAVDYTCRERLLCQQGIPPERVRVLQNAVDLARFAPRPPLPARPQRALAFGNDLRPSHVRQLQATCRQRGISLDGVGSGWGNVQPLPETVLSEYDLVFAKGRCAWEALATGCAVVVSDATRLGPLVKSSHLEEYRRANFGCRLLADPLTANGVVARIDEYDADDAARVSQAIRSVDTLTRLGDEVTALYQEVVASHADGTWGGESAPLALADYAQRLCREYNVETQQWHTRDRTWRGRVKKLVNSVAKRLPLRSHAARGAA